MTEQATSLQSFLQRYGAMRSTILGVSRQTALGDVRRESEEGAPATHRVIDLEAYSTFLDRLSEANRAARSSGAFVNVWDVAGLQREEVRTSRVLAWMLDARQTHGLGDAVLVALIDQLRAHHRWKDLSNTTILGERYWVGTEVCPLSARDNRIDVVLEGDNCIIFLEVKIDAPLGYKQLERYAEVAGKRAAVARKDFSFVIFLGEDEQVPYEVMRVRWRDVARAIRTVITSAKPEQAYSTRLLKDFAEHVEKLH